ncbi:hypothetical protein A1Q2_07892 [Trichosporon asahii var. asahii CBS 8904]|uniref:Vacuolar protein 14 C-terminal Fig4-binding domain-containing protein n=1 Tax=Trichosporon asahii var. asahii (strain CBS 8904) TaxID=1220162 RepID=K1V1R5_TRIAC|nr:hypothetical protein A1Q2_07892 [Trichosporon asahii var. asahii CBS 8904]
MSQPLTAHSPLSSVSSVTNVLKGLNDKIYERRKAAALELEKQVLSSDGARISSIIDQLCGMFAPTNAMHTRNGGLIGLAATAIALGQDVAPFLPVIIPPVLACFQDTESRVSKGEILVYFNEVFDALSKMSVKNGAELLDRLMKDIVADAAANYVSVYHDEDPERTPRDRDTSQGSQAIEGGAAGGDDTASAKDVDRQSNASPTRHDGDHSRTESILNEDRRAFSLERFIPLLTERVYAISPYTRMHLVSWLMVLNTVPDLELVAYLPEFLDGLLKYLADGNLDVRVATENLLAEFLREIKIIAQQQEKHAEMERNRIQEKRKGTGDTQQNDTDSTRGSDAGDDEAVATDDEYSDSEWDDGSWEPSQGVIIDYGAIMAIVIDHLFYPDNLVQTTAMDWILTFLDFTQTTVVAFTPKIVSAILPNLASTNRHIKAAATETNRQLLAVIQSLPLQVNPPEKPQTVTVGQPGGSMLTATTSNSTAPGTSPPKSGAPLDSPEKLSGTNTDPLESGSQVKLEAKIKSPVPMSEPSTPAISEHPLPSIPGKIARTRPHSPNPPPKGEPVQNQLQQQQQQPPVASPPEVVDDDPFDVRETVNMLTLQFLSDHPETRIAALEWLLMLHLKAPTKILSRDSGTFPALLKTLSDPSEDVVKHDLQLLAQISSSSEDSYFRSFMVNVLELFSTDRRLLETRGSLIIRQLCLHLNAEKIFRTLAEILEKDDDLEFASMMVVKLNMILITSPELSDFRRRLKNLDSKDGQMLFISLYKSWCHNAVAAFALCLLAQAYEHASNVLQIFAELELTVPLLVQIDKLVMLIESPVFTNLRLQLLEPDKYPYLSKCLYGLLMILPQSSAFTSLRARLAVVNSSGYVPPVTRPGYAQPSRKTEKDKIGWDSLLSHFRAVQLRHERARRQVQSLDQGASMHFSSPSVSSGGAAGAGAPTSGAQVRPGLPRRKTQSADKRADPSLGGVVNRVTSGLSPLNPKRVTSGAAAALVSAGGAVASMQGLGAMRPMSPPVGGMPGRRRFPASAPRR